MTADLQRRGLLSSILGRLPACSHDELRVLDLVLDRLEHDREHTPARIADTLDAIGGELVRWAGRVLAERDQAALEDKRNRALGAVRELARAGGPTRAVLDELAEWSPSQHETRVSEAPARIAARDIDERDPYEEWDLSDEHGGEGG